MTGPMAPPERLVRFCGADCGPCDTYRRFLAGDVGGLVNAETGYRCCWLPRDYPQGKDCEIRTCCEARGIDYCGECIGFETCPRMRSFYAQPGYERLRARSLEKAREKKRT